MALTTGLTGLALPFPYYSPPSVHQTSCTKFTDKNQIRTPILLRVQIEDIHFDEGIIRPSISSLEGSVTQKSEWKSHVNTLCRDFNIKTCCSLLQASNNAEELNAVHSHMIATGLDQNIFLVTKLVSMYAMWGDMNRARLVFHKTYEPDVFLWNVMIRGCVTNELYGDALAFYYQMQEAGIQPDNFTFPFVLKACAAQLALEEGKEIHDHVVRTGFGSDVFVGNSLVAMYVNCGAVEDARQVFDKMPERNVVSWTAMIAGYARIGHASEALLLFHQMQLAGVTANSITVVGVLRACSHLGVLQRGKEIHGYVMRSGFESDIFVGNSLVDMYAKCGSVEVARQLFDRMSDKNVVSWSAMIAGYAQDGRANEALTLFYQMHRLNVTVNSVTVVGVVQACAHLAVMGQGKWIHGYIIRSGFDSDVFVGNSLIDMYIKCGSVKLARQVFDRMPTRNVISWNTMIVGYTQSGHGRETFTLFHQMQVAQMKPDSATMVSVLPTCSYFAALHQGKWIHAYIIKSGFEFVVSVGNSLIDMYAKCGSIELARRLFDRMSERDLVSWNAIIAGYGIHGRGEDAAELFFEMQQAGTKPNHITFISILSACSHAGLVEMGWQYFDSMIQDYCILPRMEHYTCMVDLLGRAGRLDEAENFIKKMPLQPGVSVWGALLGACRIHCNVELGARVAEQLFDLEHEHAGFYVLLSNMYAAARRWDDVAKVRTMMKDRGVKKLPGCSSILLNNRVHSFHVGDRSHPQSEKIYALLEILSGQMKELGYVPNTNCVLYDAVQEEKEYMLSSHSEKLAIAFGLISTSPGTLIRITKNLRVCGDCHSAIKLISKIARREIIVRDANRFHHFKDGFCSCRDYW